MILRWFLRLIGYEVNWSEWDKAPIGTYRLIKWVDLPLRILFCTFNFVLSICSLFLAPFRLRDIILIPLDFTVIYLGCRSWIGLHRRQWSGVRLLIATHWCTVLTIIFANWEFFSDIGNLILLLFIAIYFFADYAWYFSYLRPAFSPPPRPRYRDPL